MTRTKFKEGYVSVNGLNMYYETHGTGQPLVLLHGAFSAIGTLFGGILPELAKTRQVIAFELQAHGHTPVSRTELLLPILNSFLDAPMPESQ